MSRYTMTSWEVKLEKSHLSRATITGKRQITIPKEITDLYKLKNGDHMIFRHVDGKTIIEPEGFTSVCPVCHGETVIDEDKKECFVCRGEGRLPSEFFESYLRIMGYISLAAFAYKIYIEYGYFNEDNTDNPYPFPVINLYSKHYSKEIIDKVRDMLQLGILQEFIGKNTAFYDKEYLPIFEKKVIRVFRTQEYKEKAKKWIANF